MTAVLEQSVQERFESASERAEFLELYRNTVHKVSKMSSVELADLRENYTIDDHEDKILTEGAFLKEFLKSFSKENKPAIVSGMGEILEAAYIIASVRTNRGTIVSRSSISYDI